MKAEKTIVCKITNPRKGKRQEIEKEYEKVQKYVQGNSDIELYSATKQAVDKYTEWNSVSQDKSYPWYLRNDKFSVEKAHSTEEFDYWAKIPVADTYGGINVPIKPHEEIKEEYNIRDSKIVRKDHGFELHLSIQTDVEFLDEYKGLIGVDLGLNKLATCVTWPDRQTYCYGTDEGKIRSRYYFLRRNCSDGYVRRKWDKKDGNKVDDICHKISRKIVDKAVKEELVIVIGDLNGVQDEDKGREMNRKLHNFPHWKLRQYIRYKAKWEGIEVVEVDEAYTSQTCSRCGELGKRHKGNFKCDACGLETDADKNGGHNIAVRGIGKLSSKPLLIPGAT